MNMHAQETPFRGEGPQPLLRAIPPGATYPVAALGPLREAVEAVQGATLAPVAIPAQSALAVASLAVQGFADVETLGGHAPPSLYCLTVAQSGERKSTCDAMLMAALRAFEREQAAQRLHLGALADLQAGEGPWSLCTEGREIRDCREVWHHREGRRGRRGKGYPLRQGVSGLQR